MSTQSFDPVQYKEGQRQEWGSAAPGWKRWWQRIEPALHPMSERMMELAELHPGQRVLDVATGGGEPAVTAARRVGTTGHVIATDLSPHMLEIGRERAAKQGLANLDFREMDGEALALPEHSFDAIFCRLGLMYLPHVHEALAHMCSLLAADGRLVAAVWGPPQTVPFISIPLGVALRELDLPPPPADRPGVFRFADAQRLQETFRHAGFAEVHTESLILPSEWRSADEFVSFHQEILIPLNALLAHHPIERQIRVWRAIAGAAEQYRTPDGILRMENEVLLVVGRPGGATNGSALRTDVPLISTVSVGSQSKLSDTPTPEVLEDKGSETPRAQEIASEEPPGTPLAGQEITVPVARIHQEDPAGVIAQTPPPARLAPPHEQSAVSGQAKTLADADETATSHQERTAAAPAQVSPSAQPQSAREQSVTPEQQGSAPHEAPVAEQEGHAAEERVTEASGDEKKEGEEEEAGPIATFRKRRIAFKTLSRPFQVLLVLTLAQIGVVALLLATQNLPQAQVSSGVVAAGRFYVVPLAAFITLTASLMAGAWFALAGALRVHWRMRWLVIALVTGLLAASPLEGLAASAGLRGALFVTEAQVYWAQLALLALIWVGAAGVSLRGRRTRRKGAALPPDSKSWHGWVFGLAVASILFYYGLDLVIWRAFIIAGFPGEGSAAFLSSIGLQTYLLPSFLILLIYWSSTDLLEWSEMLAKSVVTVTRRVSWLSVLVTALAAVGMLINVVRLEGRGIVLGLVLFAILAGIVALVVRFARIGSEWPAQIPPLSLLLGAILLYLLTDATFDLIGPFAEAHGLTQGILVSLDWLVAVPILLIALTTGLILVARGRLGKPKQGVIGLVLVMVTLLYLLNILPNILNVVGFSVAVLQRPYFPLHDMMFFAAVGALIWISSLQVRRRPLREAASTLTSVFLLLASLQAIEWLNDLTNEINALGALSPLLLAGLFVLTVLWDLVTSGEQVTNTDSPAFPREGRILLYLGYTLAATSLLLYISALRDQATGAPAPDYLGVDSAAPLVGLFYLGAPMIVVTFLLSVGRRLPRPAGAAVPQPAGRVSSRAAQFGVVGSGAVVFVLVMAFLIAGPLPRFTHANQVLSGQATYTAESPGPGCDRGGALWVVIPDAPISLRCLPAAGTRITALPEQPGYVGFFPPGNTLVQNYRISMQIDFSSAPAACVGILTHSSDPDGYYKSLICADGSWSLVRFLVNSSTILAQGRFALARTNTLVATTDGPNQSLLINGVEKASVTDSALTAGHIELEVFNAAPSTKSVLVSNYSYTPLLHSTAVATPAFSIPSSATLAFRDPLTSPGRWQNQPANGYGTTCQFVQGGYQVQVTRKEWLDDCGEADRRDYSNFVFEVQMRIVVGDCGGIDFRKTNNGPGYYFLVCRTGTYELELETRSGQALVIAQGASPFIASGLRAENLLAVVANGTSLDFYVNHQQIYGTTESTYRHGLMDISAVTIESTLTQVVYWDASVWTM